MRDGVWDSGWIRNTGVVILGKKGLGTWLGIGSAVDGDAGRVSTFGGIVGGNILVTFGN